MTVTLVRTYDPEWPGYFERIRWTLLQRLPDSALSHIRNIVHVGSTAVPDMVAKPIIDLIVVIDIDRFATVRAGLESIGYVHEGDLGIVGREAFDLRDDTLLCKLGAHHLYACSTDSTELERQLAFRNYLRQHPADAEQLSQIKWRLCEQYDNDRQAYIAGKASFVQEITRRAMANGPSPLYPTRTP